MHRPPLALAALAADLVPVVVAAVVRRGLRGGRFWMLAWCVCLAATDFASAGLAIRGIHNLWLANLVMPLSVGLALWALALWQPSELWRLTFRLGIAPLLLAWAVLTLAVEDSSTFSRAAEPMVKLATLAAAAFTLLSRGAAERGELLRRDWFWMSSGLVLYFGAGATLGPASALLASGDLRVFMLVLNTWTVACIAACLLIAKGMACPTDR